MNLPIMNMLDMAVSNDEHQGNNDTIVSTCIINNILIAGDNRDG